MKLIVELFKHDRNVGFMMSAHCLEATQIKFNRGELDCVVWFGMHESSKATNKRERRKEEGVWYD